MKKNYAKTPTVYQMEATECGAASLAMILAYHGKYMPLEQLRIETGVSRDGCNAKNIMRAGRKLGMEAKGFRKSLNSLLELKPPCIIHWNFNHFVVFEGAKGKDYYINDPAMGRRKLTYEELDAAFTGIVLTFSKTDAFQKSSKEKTLFSFIKDRLEGQYSSILALVSIGFLLVFPGLVIPVFSQVFIDDILLGGNDKWIMAFLAIMFFTVLFQAVLTFYRGLLLQKLQNKMSMISAHKFLSHMFRLPMNFFDQRFAGDLSGRVENNNSVSNFLAGDLGETVLNILVAIFYLILLLLYSPFLTLIGIISILVNVALVKFSSDSIENSTMKMQQDQGKLLGSIYAGLNITSTLKASGAENGYIGRILGYYAKTILLEQKLGKLQQALNAIPEVFNEISNILVLMFGGILVINGNMTAGMLVAYTSLLSSFTAPVNKLVGFIQKIQTLKADMSRVDDIMKYETDEKFRDTDKKIEMTTKLTGEVELDNISFGYSILEKPLVEDFSFHLTSGSSIAFVGASGCGKSTVSKIVSGLYFPWSGTVRMDQMEVRDIPKEILSSSVSTVSQSVTLFSGTIRDNLTMWNRSILEEDMIRAAKDACIHDDITKRPGAYEFELTEGGANLSGGQRQRIEIARALVTNPTILIMDEATSALDPLVEKKIIDNIKRRGCTCVIVAHRLSAIRDCDEIIVMQRGKIAQRGTHEELMQVAGHYQNLIQNT
ncbi:Lactococcin-G-processing and transport ATP-binding protein LagD [Blautia producta]|uniref:Lactococcin-G-processing and transport ATP-binding protein LagD n=1 Tax=Blautia producta TaxID=33035 RepID=A0A4P6LRQ1_9FIRM|nr:NHLP family bacteriocin export ABC transporter peptidase/permease/ATPase subunit [Blautia producta]QBE94824.1 Lactococcin-G-processing and transport ATP-binding protein LagD [Blautia producta]